MTKRRHHGGFLEQTGRPRRCSIGARVGIAVTVSLSACVVGLGLGAGTSSAGPNLGTFVPVTVASDCSTLTTGFSESGGVCNPTPADQPYLYFDGGTSASYGFTVPSGDTETITYGIPAGDYLNNVDATVSVDGGAPVTVSSNEGPIGSTTSSDLALLTSGPLGPGSHTWTINSTGHAVNVYGLWVTASAPVATTVDDAATDDPWSGDEVTGASAYDTAAITGVAAVTPTGTVTYDLFGNGSCAGSPTTSDQVSLGAGGSVPDSSATGALAAGSYGFQAHYSGDVTYQGATGACESFVVTAATSATTTTSTPTTSAVVLGSTDTDRAVVTGGGAGSPTGSVTFYRCGPTASATACTSQAHPVGSAVNVGAAEGDTATATSSSFTASSTGWWCFAAYYSGDSNYDPSSDTSSDECFDVTTASSAITTTPTNAGPIGLGTGDTDGAVVVGNGAGGSPTGSVTFYQCGPTATATACTSQAHPVGSAVNVGAAGGDTATATSSSFMPTTAGWWCFAGYYSGDPNYKPSSDTTSDECVDVSKASSSITTTPASSDVVLGSPDTDAAVVTGGAVGGSPTGTVTFYQCGPTADSCTSQAHQVGGAVNLTPGAGDTATATSASFTATVAGSWCFAAYYSGDPSYAGSSDTATTECFDVTDPLTIPTSSLPSAVVGVAYSARLEASGGTTPYSWSITSGSLPGGLKLDATTGVISGIASSPGTSDFTITVTDVFRETASAARSITSVLAVPIVSKVSPSTGFTTGATSVTITGSGFTGASAVHFGGVTASGVSVESDTTIVATAPAKSSGTVDVTVVTPHGTSATNPADQFTYTVQTRPVVVPCRPDCTDNASTPLNDTSVTVTGTSGTSPSSSLSLAVNTDTLSCGRTYDYATAVSTLLATAFAVNSLLTVTEIVGNEPNITGVKVCYEATGASTATFLRPCKKRMVAPCQESLVEQGGSVVATFVVPANDPRFWAGGAPVDLKSFSPTKGGPGTMVTIKGKNLTGVGNVVMGGVKAAIETVSPNQLVVVVPTGAATGFVSVTAASGTATSLVPFTVT